MIYLDNAATGGSKPVSVQNALSASVKLCANPGRSGHALSLALAERVLACRNLLSELFDGYGYERVIFTKNCTEALNIALLGTLGKGDHVITTSLEHNSVLRPLTYLERTGKITLTILPLKEGKILPEEVEKGLRKETAAVVVTSASNVTGECPDLAAIGKVLPPRVKFYVDGAQGGGHIPLRMKELGIDALALAGHKGLFAIQGAGALLFSDRIDPDPILFGGTGSESFNLSMPDFYPDRLESGTLSYPAIATLYEGLLLVKAHLAEYGKHLTETTRALISSLKRMRGITVYSSPNPCGIVAFAHTMPSQELAEILSERFQLAVRSGLHCAPLVHKELGTFPDGLTRVSLSPFQGKKECDALLSALSAISRENR